jgi:hypothetical protein
MITSMSSPWSETPILIHAPSGLPRSSQWSSDAATRRLSPVAHSPSSPDRPLLLQCGRTSHLAHMSTALAVHMQNDRVLITEFVNIAFSVEDPTWLHAAPGNVLTFGENLDLIHATSDFVLTPRHHGHLRFPSTNDCPTVNTSFVRSVCIRTC